MIEWWRERRVRAASLAAALVVAVAVVVAVIVTNGGDGAHEDARDASSTLRQDLPSHTGARAPSTRTQTAPPATHAESTSTSSQPARSSTRVAGAAVSPTTTSYPWPTHTAPTFDPNPPMPPGSSPPPGPRDLTVIDNPINERDAPECEPRPSTARLSVTTYGLTDRVFFRVEGGKGTVDVEGHRSPGEYVWYSAVDGEQVGPGVWTVTAFAEGPGGEEWTNRVYFRVYPCP